MDPDLEGKVARSLKVKVLRVSLVAAETMYRPGMATEAVVEAVHPGHKRFFFGRI